MNFKVYYVKLSDDFDNHYSMKLFDFDDFQSSSYYLNYNNYLFYCFDSFKYITF